MSVELHCRPAIHAPPAILVHMSPSFLLGTFWQSRCLGAIGEKPHLPGYNSTEKFLPIRTPSWPHQRLEGPEAGQRVVERRRHLNYVHSRICILAGPMFGHGKLCNQVRHSRRRKCSTSGRLPVVHGRRKCKRNRKAGRTSTGSFKAPPSHSRQRRTGERVG